MNKLQITLPLLLSFAFLSTAAMTAEASAKDVFETEKACMYAESMLQDHILIGLKINYGEPAKDILRKNKIVSEFLEDISNHHNKDKFQKEIKEVKDLWMIIISKLTIESDLTASVALKDQVNEFVEKCELLGEDLANSEGSDTSEIMVLVGEMGIEIEKTAVDYLLKSWGYEDSNYYQETEKDLKKYKELHLKLNTIKEVESNQKIQSELALIDKNYLVFKFMASSKSGRFVPLIVAKNSLKILKHIEIIVDLERGL